MPYDVLGISLDNSVLLKTLPDLTETGIREAAAAITGSTAWIVSPTTMEDSKLLAGVIEDRGVKHPSIELSRTMLRGDGHLIPMIDGQFSSSGKLLNSVQKLLKKAEEFSPKLFIIGVSDNIFNELLKTARCENSLKAVSVRAFGGTGGSVLSLLDIIPEPARLRDAFIGDSADAIAVRQFIMRAALVDDTVLITGDTGTGKEIVAQQIHGNSCRKDKPFKAVNCGAFPHDLLESELFGYVPGAFTGGRNGNEGLWKAADGGTLFLDEIGELTPAHQAKILRALQEKEIRKVGSTEVIKVNARIICATNRDLFALLQAGQFREDLYYRIRCFLVTTPPLREHPDDIPALARVFWRQINHDDKAVLPDEIITLLLGYSWPGNVRELKMILSHLFGLFRTTFPLGRRHLQAVFELQGLPAVEESHTGIQPGDKRQEQLTAFRRLRRGYETIRAVEHLLAPVLAEIHHNSVYLTQIKSGVANLLNEIDLIGRIPRDFSPNTFENISRLRSRLDYFLSEYEKSPDSAVEYLRAGTGKILEDVVSDILGEIEEVLTGSMG